MTHILDRLHKQRIISIYDLDLFQNNRENSIYTGDVTLFHTKGKFNLLSAFCKAKGWWFKEDLSAGAEAGPFQHHLHTLP